MQSDDFLRISLFWHLKKKKRISKSVTFYCPSRKGSKHLGPLGPVWVWHEPSECSQGELGRTWLELCEKKTDVYFFHADSVARGQVKVDWSWSVDQGSFVAGDFAPDLSWWVWWWQSVSFTRLWHSEGLRSLQPRFLGLFPTYPHKPRLADASKAIHGTNGASISRRMPRKSGR